MWLTVILCVVLCCHPWRIKILITLLVPELFCTMRESGKYAVAPSFKVSNGKLYIIDVQHTVYCSFKCFIKVQIMFLIHFILKSLLT